MNNFIFPADDDDATDVIYSLQDILDLCSKGPCNFLSSSSTQPPMTMDDGPSLQDALNDIFGTSFPTQSPIDEKEAISLLDLIASFGDTTIETPSPTEEIFITGTPTNSPTLTPTEEIIITESPTNSPTLTPTEEIIITESPTNSPTLTPTEEIVITESPTNSPTLTPTEEIIITESPTNSPTAAPTEENVITESPTNSPTATPTQSPVQETDIPTQPPTNTPTQLPTNIPTQPPTNTPTQPPTNTPTQPPTNTPTQPPVEVTSNQTESPVEVTSTIPPTKATSAPTVPPTTAITNAPIEDAIISPSDPPVDDLGTEPPVSIVTSAPTSSSTSDGTIFATSFGSVSSTFTGSETGAPDINFAYSEPEVILNVLIIGDEIMKRSMKRMAKEYTIFTDGKVTVNLELSTDDYPKIKTDGKLGVSEYDAFIINPTKAGVASLIQNFNKLDEYVKQEEFDFAWNDVFTAYRDNINKFEDTLYMVPIQGDVLSMYYRRDVLEQFGLPVPKTWQDYSNVAAAVHGQSYGDATLIGSCVPRRKGCSSYLWTNLILASMTQYQGTKSGFFLDPFTMKPLTGEALAETIKILEGQVLHGNPDEFSECDTYITETTNKWMKEGRCVLTYSWGSVFKAQAEEGSTVKNLVSAAPTPGSLYVFDRTSNKLERCNEELCGKSGYYDNEVGWINQAPYAAYGGFAGAMPRNIDPEKAIDSASFLAFASNNLLKAENATKLLHDPYRESQLNVNAYEGISIDEVQTYLDIVKSSLTSENLVMDVRFSEANELNQAYEDDISDHLERVLAAGTPSSNEDRMRVSDLVTSSMNDVIRFHDTFSDKRAVTKYQESLNLMVGGGVPASLGSSAAVRTDAWASTVVCVICIIYRALF